MLLNRLVSTVRVPVHVWMEGCREPMVSTQVRSYPGPESVYVLGAAICNNGVRDATVADDVFKDEPGQFRRVSIIPPQEL